MGLTDSQFEEFKRLYSEGKTVEEIASLFGMARSSLWFQSVKTRGYKLPSRKDRGFSKRKPYSFYREKYGQKSMDEIRQSNKDKRELQILRAIELFNDGKKMGEIQKIVKMKRVYLSQGLRDHGFELRRGNFSHPQK